MRGRHGLPTLGVLMNLAYYWYEAAHWMLSPARAATEGAKLFFENPINPLTHTAYGRTVAAACELFERTTRRYDKPVFGLDTTVVDGERVPVTEDRKSTRLNSSHANISYAVFCLKKKKLDHQARMVRLIHRSRCNPFLMMTARRCSRPDLRTVLAC